MKRLKLVAAALLCMALLIGCGGVKLRGTYQSAGRDDLITFEKDGTFYEDVGLSGTYEIKEDMLILKAGILSVTYEIVEYDGYYIFRDRKEDVFGNRAVYVPVDHYDEYMAANNE